MSSNVLKDLNDCYNFKDENNSENKTKGRQRQRLRTYSLNSKSSDSSKNVVKEKTKRDNKWRCDLFKQILSRAVWLNDIRPDSRSSVNSVLDLLNEHMTEDCDCVNICSSHILIGNTYFERFLLNRQEFENKVIAEENKDLETKTSDDSKTAKSSTFNDIPSHKESRLESHLFPDLVNLNNMTTLLSPLEQAVDHWNQAFEISLKMNILTEEMVIGLKLYNNLSSVIQIYCLYNQIECRLRAAELFNKYCLKYGNRVSEISLTANYYLVKTYLELGAVTKAAQTHTRLPFPSVANQTNQRLPQTFGKSLNLLAKCEIDLMGGQQTQTVANTLKSFIESEYLQKLTVNRYYIKGLSLLLSTKFNSKDFDFSKYFQEFLEPIQMSISILKRWYPWLSSFSKTNNQNQMTNSGDLDPIWYKFAAINYAFDTMQMSAHFYSNIEMPIDTTYYFNSLLKLGRRFCSAVRISKLLVMGSHLDLMCDYKPSAQTKIFNASLCLQSKTYSIGSESAFDSHSSVSTISPETRKAMEGSGRYGPDLMKNDSDIEVFEMNSNYETIESEDCQHNRNRIQSLWDLKKKLRQKNNSSDDSDNSIQEIGRNMNQISFDRSDYPKGILELFFAKIEVDLQKLLVNESDQKYILRQINDLLKNSFESYSRNVLKQQIEELLSNYRLEELYQNCDYYKSLKLKIFETIAGIQTEAKDYSDAVRTCSEVSCMSASTYEQRISQSNILYSEGFSKLNLYRIKHNITANKVWLQYNGLQDVSPDTNSTAAQSLTPTRPESKIKSSVPKAPKQKTYMNEEYEDYVKALSKCVYEESKTESNDNNVSRIKSTMKLNLENDTELRSVSVGESNLPTNERTVTEDMISSETVANKKSSHKSISSVRMTRSRASSLKIKCEEPKTNVETKTEKKSNRSTAKSSKKESEATEVIDLTDFNTDLEQLDEVFAEKLIINEKTSNENGLTLESIIAILKRIFDLISSHPSSKLYLSVHKLLTDIYSISDQINEELIGYHFSESVRSTYRYRNLFIAERKRKLNRSTIYDLNSVFFDNNIEANNSSKIFTDCLPTDWRIIQLMAVQNDSKTPELMVCRYQSGKKPIYLRLRSDPQKIIKHFITHFGEIIDRSNASIVNKDRETFWRLRYSLDEELMVLLNSVEETCFGPFKGILFGQLQSNGYLKMCRRLRYHIISAAKKEDLLCSSEALLGVIVESLPLLKYSEFRVAIKLLFTTPSDSLIANCFSKYEEMFCDVFPLDNKEAIFTSYHLSPVALILDKSLESFPFECLPTIHRINQSIFRTPSLRILTLMYNTFKDTIYSKGVDQSKVFYVLNPSDNLAKTEDFFKSTFQAMKEWEGVVGKPPNPLELKKAFDSKDAYIFFGHGAGASYYRSIPEGLDSCTVNCASVVIGCSSGKLFSDGKQLESYGTAHRFLMNGCPSYVGVLWDVTDKDIDKFSDHLLSYWFSKWKPELNTTKKSMPITKAVSMSRQYCRLKYLIGAAPVVYGLPLSTQI